MNAIKNKKAAPQQAADAVAQIKAYNEQLPGHQVAKVVAHGVGYAGAAGLGALAATEVIKHHQYVFIRPKSSIVLTSIFSLQRAGREQRQQRQRQQL